MTSQSGQKTTAIHIVPNISRRKSNQKMELGQSIDYNMWNIFFEKSKYGGETIPRSLSKQSKLSIFLDQQCKVLKQFIFIVF